MQLTGEVDMGSVLGPTQVHGQASPEQLMLSAVCKASKGVYPRSFSECLFLPQPLFLDPRGRPQVVFVWF